MQAPSRFSMSDPANFSANASPQTYGASRACSIASRSGWTDGIFVVKQDPCACIEWRGMADPGLRLPDGIELCDGDAAGAGTRARSLQRLRRRLLGVAGVGTGDAPWGSTGRHAAGRRRGLPGDGRRGNRPDHHSRYQPVGIGRFLACRAEPGQPAQRSRRHEAVSNRVARPAVLRTLYLRFPCPDRAARFSQQRLWRLRLWTYQSRRHGDLAGYWPGHDCWSPDHQHRGFDRWTDGAVARSRFPAHGSDTARQGRHF